jgi:hypothetical protein
LETAGIKIIGKPRAVERARYMIAIGAFTVAWSTLEYIFDLCIAIIYERAPEGKSLEKVHPLMLSHKIRLFKKAHKKINALKQHIDDAERITLFMKEVGDIRHMIAHSVAVRSEELDTSHLRRMVIRKGLRSEERANIGTQDIAKLTRAITDRFAQLIAYCNFLAETFPDRPT